MAAIDQNRETVLVGMLDILMGTIQEIAEGCSDPRTAAQDAIAAALALVPDAEPLCPISGFPERIFSSPEQEQ